MSADALLSNDKLRRVSAALESGDGKAKARKFTLMFVKKALTIRRPLMFATNSAEIAAQSHVRFLNSKTVLTTLTTHQAIILYRDYYVALVHAIETASYHDPERSILSSCPCPTVSRALEPFYKHASPDKSGSRETHRTSREFPKNYRPFGAL